MATYDKHKIEICKKKFKKKQFFLTKKKIYVKFVFIYVFNLTKNTVFNPSKNIKQKKIGIYAMCGV